MCAPTIRRKTHFAKETKKWQTTKRRKKSVHADYSKEKDVSPKSNNKKVKNATIPETEICPLIADHEEREFDGLLE